MKLILCSVCKDVFRLQLEDKHCECGLSGGHYKDKQHAEVYGNAVPIGFNNESLLNALNKQPETGDGEIFEAFVIPKKCYTVVKIREPNNGKH